MIPARAGILVAVLSGCVLLAPAAADSVLNVGAVSHVSGGAGTESIGRSNSKGGNFNLKLVFAQKSGKDLSSVQVTVADPAGRMFLDTTSQGSWLLARLPAGRYRVSASFGGKSVTQDVALDAAKLRTLRFRWS